MACTNKQKVVKCQSIQHQYSLHFSICTNAAVDISYADSTPRIQGQNGWGLYASKRYSSRSCCNCFFSLISKSFVRHRRSFFAFHCPQFCIIFVLIWRKRLYDCSVLLSRRPKNWCGDATIHIFLDIERFSNIVVCMYEIWNLDCFSCISPI